MNVTCLITSFLRKYCAWKMLCTNLFFHQNLFSDVHKFEWKITSRLTQSVQKEQRRDLKEITKAERQLRILDALTFTWGSPRIRCWRKHFDLTERKQKGNEENVVLRRLIICTPNHELIGWLCGGGREGRGIWRALKWRELNKNVGTKT